MEKTISLEDAFEIVKKRVKLIISFIIGAAMVSAAISYFLLTPTYQANSQFIVNQSGLPSESFDVNQIRSNVELINTYSVIIKSPAILDQVIGELGLSTTADQLREQLTIFNEEDSQVVTVTVTNPDPVTAAEVANKTVEIFQQRIPVLMNIDNVYILSPAQVNAAPQQVSPDPGMNITLSIVLGALLGIGLAFLLDYLDKTIKTESDIEENLGLPILGAVSYYKEESAPVEFFQNSAATPIMKGEYQDAAKKTI